MRSICVVLFAVLFCGCLAFPNFDTRIVGGSNAALGEIPYIISIRAQNRHGCGGAILNEKYVLTAAHCFFGWSDRPDLFTIQYGIVEISEKGNVLPVKKITLHEDYVHSGTYPNDIAIVEVNGSFDFGANAQPVKLPTPFEDPGEVNALLAGWGLDKTGGQIMMHLQKVVIQIFSDDYCKTSDSKYDSDLQFCAGVRGGGKGQCTGDSGGPIAIDGIQYGIVSWSHKPCASNGNPGYFTKVTTHRNWIKKNTGV